MFPSNFLYAAAIWPIFLSLQEGFFRHHLPPTPKISPWSWWILLIMLLHGFLSKSLHRFVMILKIDIWISVSFYKDLLKLLHGFVKVSLCISRSMPNKPKLNKISKLVEPSAFKAKVVEWINLLNSALGPWCLWQWFCFEELIFFQTFKLYSTNIVSILQQVSKWWTVRKK